jgi:acyl-CoA thioesterase-1
MQQPKILLISLVFCFSLLSGCESRIANIRSAGEDIICFGDSLTKGTGSTKGNDYPSVLAGRSGMHVINAGVEGDTTREALKRIEKDVSGHDPRIVIVEFSGNDFLQGIPMRETFENLDKIVDVIEQKGAMVVLVEVRAGLFEDEYIAGFRQIAKKKKALLIPNILKGILSNPSLRSDEIHPNDAGYQIMADRIYKEIKPLLR